MRLKTFSNYFVGFYNNDKGLRVDLFDRAADTVHLLIIAGAHDHSFFFFRKTSFPFQKGAASSGDLIDHICDLLSLVGDDKRHFSSVDPIHDFIYYDGQEKSDDHTIDQAVNVFGYHQGSEKNDHAVHNKGNLSQRKMGLFGFDRKHDKVRASCRRLPHIDQGIAQTG